VDVDDSAAAGVAPLPSTTRGRGRRLPHVDAHRCTGCGRCVGACDEHLLSLEPRGWEKSAVLHDAGRCTGCTLCAVICPFHAITMHPRAGSRAGPPGGAVNP
jgi:ferredoxin